MIEGIPPKKKATFDEALMSGGLGDLGKVDMGSLKEVEKGVYSGYVRNPPVPGGMAR